MLHRASVINMDRVGMLQRVDSNSAENSVIDSTWINEPYRACMLPRVGFHAADRANMLNSAGSDSAKSAGQCRPPCWPVQTCDVLCTVPDSTGVDSTEGACYSYIGNAGSPACSIGASVVPAAVMPDSIYRHSCCI